MDAALSYYDNPNYTYSSVPNNSISYENVSEDISFHYTTDYQREESISEVVIDISIGVISIFGAVGNGIVIWLLSFRIKRNPFSTYILNLAVADLGVLVSLTLLLVDMWIEILYGFSPMFPLFLFLFFSTYSTSQFLLTAISIDKCVAVFFPLWHRCRRPPHLSAIVCVIMWFLSLLLTSVSCTFILRNLGEPAVEDYYQFVVNALLCLPIMTAATAALFIKVCFKPQQRRRGKLLTIILLTLLFFLLFAFPLNVMIVLYIFGYFPSYILHCAMLLACLNSSVNPAIYILVGRPWKSRQRENMKMIFQKVFKEEDGCSGETSVETQL